MRILLDECLPTRLARDLVGHDARSVVAMGWAGRRNGDLLRLAEQEFDVFLTVDRNLSFQQDLSRFDVAVIVLRARSNQVRDLRVLIPDVLAACRDIQPGQAVIVG